jgi:hypothetical protein
VYLLDIARGSSRSQSVDNSLWKRLWTFRKTDKMNEYADRVVILHVPVWWYTTQQLRPSSLFVFVCLGFKVLLGDHRQSLSPLHRVRINYRRISLRHNLNRKCRKIVKFLSITHSECIICNGPIVTTDISRVKRKPVLQRNGCLTDRA